MEKIPIYIVIISFAFSSVNANDDEFPFLYDFIYSRAVTYPKNTNEYYDIEYSDTITLKDWRLVNRLLFKSDIITNIDSTKSKPVLVYYNIYKDSNNVQYSRDSVFFYLNKDFIRFNNDFYKFDDTLYKAVLEYVPYDFYLMLHAE